MFRQGKMGCFSVESCVRSYSRQTQVTSARIKDFPCWGWLDWTCQTTREPTTPTKTFGRPVLENSYYADARIATVLIRFLWWLSRANTSGSTALNDRYWPRFCWSCFCFLHFSVHFLSYHTQDSLRKGILWIKSIVSGAQVAKKSHDKTSPVRTQARVYRKLV